MKKIVILATLFATLQVAGQSNRQAMSKLIDQNMELAVKQYKMLAGITPGNVMPRTFDEKQHRLVTSNTEWWTSGFFPGCLWYLYEYSKDTAIKAEAERRLAILEDIQHFTGSHDLGFMMFCSFGNAYRITQQPEYRDVITTAAESLIKRYRPEIRSIQSWGRLTDTACQVIIDNMMNLEMLNWVSDQWREPKYKSIAIAHANTTMKNHFRPDYSSYHVVVYNAKDGSIIRKKTAQGFSDESAWSRGQSWGLYGYTMMYRFTHEQTYLDQARHIANFILQHPNLPADGVPYWDYNATGPNAHYRDVSAGSILASALLELAQYDEPAANKRYVAMAEKIIKSLSTAAYRTSSDELGGFLLKHSVGSLPGNSEVDVPLTYADYYYLEALMRYKQWYLQK